MADTGRLFTQRKITPFQLIHMGGMNKSSTLFGVAQYARAAVAPVRQSWNFLDGLFQR